MICGHGLCQLCHKCGRSQKRIGCIYTLGEAIIGWSSKTQRTATILSTEAEYMAMSTANQELLFMQNLMGELGVAVQPGLLFNDNQGAIALVKNNQVGQ